MSSPIIPASLESGINKKRTAVKLSGAALLFLSFQTLGMLVVVSFAPGLTRHVGIIYSDIGTSPLYVLNGIWPGSGDVPSREDIIGGISAIIWSLTLIPLIKYVRPMVVPSSPIHRLIDCRQVFISLIFGTQEGS